MASIAKRGFAETTMGDVARGAKLSHGTVNFHFRSKDQLLVETLRHVADEYREAWRRAVDRAGPGAADKLAALCLAAFDPAVCTRRKLAVWHAFYGEAKSRPNYLKICGERDQEHLAAAIDYVGQVIAEGPYPQRDAALIARGLEALTDGLWLELVLAPGPFDREGARDTVRAYLTCLFPGHFPAAERSAA